MATKTKDVIIDSYLSLVDKCDFNDEKISITDIVKECNISRQTFYYHFTDIEDMLTWTFQRETDKIIKVIPSSPAWYDSAQYFEKFFEKYGNLLKKTLNTKDFVFIYSLLNKMIYDYSKSFLESKYHTPYNKQTEFLLLSCSYAFIGFIIKELKKDNPDFHAMLKDIANYLQNNTSKK